MASFPDLHGGSTVHIGSARETRHQTEVVEFADDTEQRWKSGPPLTRWTLVFRRIDGVDLSEIRQFFIDQKGRFDSTWDITIDGTLYDNMVFTEDEFPPVEPADTPETFNLTLECIQVK